MLKQLYFLILIQFPFVVLGQSVFPDKLPKVLPERFHIELDNDSISYFAKQKKKINTINDRSLLFINQFTKKDYFDSGVIAWNYDTIETYLNEIVTKLIPKEVIEEFNIHVYPSKEADFNAAALPDGTIFFNIHNFIYLNTESEIASILGHEIGHVLQEYGGGYEWLDYMNSFDFFNSKKRKFASISQSVEIEADYFSFTLIESSGYNNTSASSVFELFSKISNGLTNKINYQPNRYLKTHPSSQERIDSSNTWVKAEQGSNFLVDSLLFYRIKQGSRTNSLKYLMESHQYYGCFELALEGYLADGNLDCAYYIAESMRRLLYKDSFKPNNILFSGIYKSMFAYNCLDRVAKDIFISQHSDTILNELKSKRIYTYQKFFEYFMNVVSEEYNTEILLTKGLYEYKKSNKKNLVLLKKYVENNGKYKLFVQELITPTAVTQPKSVYVFNNVSVWNCEGKKKVQHYFLEKELEHQFDSLSGVIFKEKCPVKDNNYIGVRNHLQVNLEESYFLNHLSNLVWDRKSTKYNLTILSPELGQYLIENNYSSFQYIDYYYQACISSGASILLGVMAGVSVPSDMHMSKIIQYKKNNKSCIGYNVVTGGKLSLSDHKYKLGYAISKSMH